MWPKTCCFCLGVPEQHLKLANLHLCCAGIEMSMKAQEHSAVHVESPDRGTAGGAEAEVDKLVSGSQTI